jgi:hypothetical protein
VDKFEVSLLLKLSKDSMLFVALHCWTRLFQQSFLAICGYYIDTSWRLHEVVLGFELLTVHIQARILAESKSESFKSTKLPTGHIP